MRRFAGHSRKLRRLTLPISDRNAKTAPRSNIHDRMSRFNNCRLSNFTRYERFLANNKLDEDASMSRLVLRNAVSHGHRISREIPLRRLETRNNIFSHSITRFHNHKSNTNYEPGKAARSSACLTSLSLSPLTAIKIAVQLRDYLLAGQGKRRRSLSSDAIRATRD